MKSRRVAFGAVSGVLFLTGLSQAVSAAPPSPSKGGKTPPPQATTTTMAPTTTTTSPPPPPPPSAPPPHAPRTPEQCSAPDAKHDVAPAVGSTNKYQAGPGGAADITHSGQAELKVANVSPAPGWSDIVFTPSGQSVRVKYTDGSNPHHYVRLVVTLNNSGTEIHVRTTTCQ